MKFAEALIELLELEGVKYVFGHPGEQILPLYEALRISTIKHVLMRHEQGAAHAADAYARTSGKFGVCIASAGPGALNLTMGIATAYKDSVPLLVITGDVPLHMKGYNVFQEVDTSAVFKPITLESTSIKNSGEGLNKLKEAVNTFKKGRTGPIHLSIPRDVFDEDMSHSLIDEAVYTPPKKQVNSQKVDEKILKSLKLIEKSEKPVIIAGTGVIWSKAADKLQSFANQHHIPVATTYPARGVYTFDEPLHLGMIGIRGTEAANYAGVNADLVIALGTRLSERTMAGIGECQIIQVNTNKKSLKGKVNLEMDVKRFFDHMKKIKTADHRDWLDSLAGLKRSYDIQTDFKEIPVKPQKAVKEILDAAQDAVIVNDAGSHTTWVTLLQKIKEPSSQIFSGGFGPMGYALPASVGVALANPEKKVVVIVGDGGFQMTLQELATIVQWKLPIVICIINNQSLGIIKQWQKMNYGKIYEVELLNPDFVKLALSYGIDSVRVNAPDEIYLLMKKALTGNKPYLLEVMVDKDEEIPLPRKD
ncbi:MAG TPA: thiamine pyrophosphate-binding protein [Methanobacterium sp.]|nr:thiamine pyrophosphate-binding protein [Methanobacterium sp.]